MFVKAFFSYLKKKGVISAVTSVKEHFNFG